MVVTKLIIHHEHGIIRPVVRAPILTWFVIWIDGLVI